MRLGLQSLFQCIATFLQFQLTSAGFALSGVVGKGKCTHTHASWRSSSTTQLSFVQCLTVPNSATTIAAALSMKNTDEQYDSPSCLSSNHLNVMELPCAIPIEGASIQFIGGRRCLHITSYRRRSKMTNNAPSSASPPSTPPLVILGGMAQCIESWQHHFLDFSRERDVLMIEYLGQGLGSDYENKLIHDESESKEDMNDKMKEKEEESIYFSTVDLDFHARDIPPIIHKVFAEIEMNDSASKSSGVTVVDIVAFSLGARVAMAIMAHHPNLIRIRRAHLTGIGAERDGHGKIIFQSWHDLLSPLNRNHADSPSTSALGYESRLNHNDHDDFALRSFAWSILLATYSKPFLSINGPEKVSSWVDHICINNRRAGLYALLTQTSSMSPMDHVDMIRSKVKVGNNHEWKTAVQIVVGGDDIIAPVQEATRLNDAISALDDYGNENGASLSVIRDVIVYANCGHAVLNENAREWRRDAIKFLMY